MEDYYEYLDSNGVTTLYKLIKDDTVALINGYSVTLNNITTNLDNHVNNTDIHTPISDIENMVDTKVSGLVNSAPETLDTLKELSDALGNDPNFATTVANQIGNKADKDSVYTKLETDTLLESKANSVHSHVVSDITDMPTIPTKTSQLINDSGFLTSSSGVITSVSWSDITNKPNFSTVATSGSYTDLSNTPAIPTKVSQLENDTGFVSGLTDVVDTKSNQTINGTKTFTQGIKIKNSDIDLTITPTSNKYSTYLFTDKNNANTASLQYSQRTYGVNDICFYVSDADSNSHGFRIRTDNRLEPIKNNTYSLGSSSAKWSDVYSTNAYIDRVVCTRFTHSVNNGSVYITGGSEYDKGATLVLHGEESSDAGSFIINSRDKTRSLYLVGKPDGTLQWAGQNIALDNNLVHRSGDETIAGNKTFSNRVSFPSGYYMTTEASDNSLRIIRSGSGHGNNYKVIIQGDTGKFFAPNGFIGNLQGNADTATSANDPNAVHKSGNETINGVKSFNNLMYIYDNMSNKNSQMDLFKTPANTLYSHYMFVDKNNEVCAYMQYGQQHHGNDFIGLFIHDKNRALHGIQVTTNNEVIPISNNTYGLGTANNKWANVYATTFNGNLVGGLTLNQSSLKMTVKDSNSETTRTNDVILANSSNTSYGINVSFGGSGNTVVGAGESYTAQLNELAGNSAENLYLTADGNIYFKPNANTLANAKTITLSSAAELSGLVKVTSTSFVGALTGNVTGNCSGSSGSCTGNAATATSATKASYLDNYSVPNMNKIYLDWDKQVDNYVGLKVDNTVMGGLITTKNIGSQAANSATYATTQATTDNSTKIATTAWVRTYVNSVAGNNTVGSSVSAYWSNSSLVTATGQSSSGGYYPECYSEYVSKTPVVGTIYSGAQLYTVLNTYASATGSKNNTTGIYFTSNKAQATLSNPLSSTAKYLCTTANTFSFRAYTARGNTSSVGTSSVVNATLTKSIFIRVQ